MKHIEHRAIHMMDGAPLIAKYKDDQDREIKLHYGNATLDLYKSTKTYENLTSFKHKVKRSSYTLRFSTYFHKTHTTKEYKANFATKAGILMELLGIRIESAGAFSSLIARQSEVIGTQLSIKNEWLEKNVNISSSKGFDMTLNRYLVVINVHCHRFINGIGDLPKLLTYSFSFEDFF